MESKYYTLFTAVLSILIGVVWSLGFQGSIICFLSFIIMAILKMVYDDLS